MKKNATATTESQDLRELYKDERTEKKIQEHLNNEDDIITIQDIANAPTGLVSKKDRREPTDLTPTEVDAFNEDEEISDRKKVKDNDDPAIETSWNILGS